MQAIKSFINLMDYVVATFWGLTVYDIVGVLFAGNSIANLDGIIKILFAIVGLFYSCVRLYDFWHKSKIERKIKSEELEKITRENDKENGPGNKKKN
ncbi:hypothetical protein U9K52_08435 [Chryseobacterium sp. MHB01]|uniref:hypothetical protein n=1 Tax=Chryseobacterium sp. MHB01 TaxID=3109433 RepID=UPI002AFF60F1|nr:hypothetical protein [Chryseobacterium sp. MHB01]MEA1848935.1 hypothetical protein [Chryseobacterium sp. MHB01]